MKKYILFILLVLVRASFAQDYVQLAIEGFDLHKQGISGKQQRNLPSIQSKQ